MALITRLNNSIIVIVRMIFGSSFFCGISGQRAERDRGTEGQRDKARSGIKYCPPGRYVSLSHCLKKKQKGQRQRDKETKRGRVSKIVRQVAMSHCLIVSKKNSETTHTFYDLWYSQMRRYHKKLTEALHLYKMSIDATLIEKLLVCTLLGNTTLIYNVDAICIVDGTKAMSNDNRCSTLKKVC